MANKQIIRKWVDELRSGKWKQGDGRLATGPDYFAESKEVRYCCLGVLCEMAVESGIISRFSTHSRGYAYGKSEMDSRICLLPVAVIDWAGFSEDEGGLNDDPMIECPDRSPIRCSAANDHGATFPEIASMIEATYLKEGDSV